MQAPAILDPASLICRPGSILVPLDLSGMFPAAQPLEVELGSGDGSFLITWAGLNSEHNFFGVERLLGRLRKVDRKGRRANLKNLRLMRIEASYLLEYLLPPASVHALHVYFPDPWPKRRHRKNRLVNESFPRLAGMALSPGGMIYLRTDDADYFGQMQEVFSASADFEPVETPSALSEVLTDFERGFQLRGVATLRAAYRRRA